MLGRGKAFGALFKGQFFRFSVNFKHRIRGLQPSPEVLCSRLLLLQKKVISIVRDLRFITPRITPMKGHLPKN